jgi:alkylated DNA nucleotide flippase Atl1
VVSFDESVALNFIATIPKGSWTTYGDVADAAGNRGAAQHAGNWLRDSGGSIPFYWRVIDANGEVPPGFIASALGLPRNPVEARQRLQDEGVILNGQQASKQCLYSVNEWRAAGQPSGASAAAAWQLSELETYVAERLVELPADLGELEALARTELSIGDAIAVNRSILAESSSNVPAHTRLGRAYEELNLWDIARGSYETAIALDRRNSIARGRLEQLNRKHPPGA